MEGYDVVTSDGENAGHVVRTEDGLLIVEHGTLFKARHALPETFTRVDHDERVVHTTLSKHLIESSPKVGDSVDRAEVAAHYGLAEGVAAPETGGYGELNADDPALSAEQHAQRLGVPTAPEQRLASGEPEPGTGDITEERLDAVEDRQDRPIANY